MTSPSSAQRFSIEQAPLGVPLFRSWVLLFGVVPIDWDDLFLERVDTEAPFGFVETSTMLTQRVWRHERRIEDDGDGCIVVDTITFAPRVALLGALFSPMFRLAFRHRHRRLRARFT